MGNIDSDVEGRLAAKDEEIAMLRLQLDVNIADDKDREQRLTDLERRVDRQDKVIDEYLGAVSVMCSYLVTETERLRASS